MPTRLPHLASRLFNTPLALAPGKLEVIMRALHGRFGVCGMEFPGSSREPLAFGGDASIFMLDDDGSDGDGPATPYDLLGNPKRKRVARIEVSGSLVHKNNYLRPYSGMTGYDSVRTCLTLAGRDNKAGAIMLDIDSPGGEVSGCFDLADAIHAMRGDKPIWAICSETAFSAAYALASACDRVIIPRTGAVGSVGVICAVIDLSRALDAAGVTVHLLTYGDRKADGNESTPLSEPARIRFQADVDAMGSLFCETVGRNRKMKSSKVKATQAGTFMGQAGVDIGFADAVMSPDAATAELLDLIR